MAYASALQLLIKTSHKVLKAAVRVKTFLLRHPVSLGFVLDIKLTHHENYHTSIAASSSPLVMCCVHTEHERASEA